MAHLAISLVLRLFGLYNVDFWMRLFGLYNVDFWMRLFGLYNVDFWMRLFGLCNVDFWMRLFGLYNVISGCEVINNKQTTDESYKYRHDVLMLKFIYVLVVNQRCRQRDINEVKGVNITSKAVLHTM